MDASICSWGVISEAMGDRCDSFMCCMDLATDVFPGCVHSAVRVESKAHIFERSGFLKGKGFGGL